MKVVLVHDYLKEYGGAERVVEALHELFPDAPLYVAYYDLAGLGAHQNRFNPPAGGWNIKSSILQWLPGAGKLISPLRILAPKIFASFDLSAYDVVISSCNVYFSKAVKTNSKQLHLSYIHTPPRYLYGYATSFNYKKNPLVRVVAELMNHFLRIVDFEVSQHPDILIANSENVAARIKKFYRRDSVIIYPPVEIEKFAGYRKQVTEKYFLSVGRLVKGKGMDTIVKAFARLGKPLKVVGTGPEMENLKSQVSNVKSIEFLGQVSDENLSALYTNALATVVASEDEDFGIVPVESLAAGTPVIAPKSGGFKETITPKTGVFFGGDRGQAEGTLGITVDSLIQTLQEFDPKKFKAADCIKQAEKFSKERFKKEMLDLIDKKFKI